MTICAVAISTLDRLRSRAGALIRDQRGIAAVEFALIVPLLLSLYFVTMEVSQAIETNKKVSRMSSMVADLITQQQAISQCEVNAVMTIGDSILQPYGRSNSTITVTAIEITALQGKPPKALVEWSRKRIGGKPEIGETKGSVATVPEDLMTPGFLIRVDSDLPYQPVITWTPDQQTATGLGVMGKIFENGKLDMKETYYLRPRMSATIPCADCIDPKIKC